MTEETTEKVVEISPLIAILTAKREAPGSARLQLHVRADMGGGPQEFDFFYDPTDPHGLTPWVTKWISENPRMTVAP